MEKSIALGGGPMAPFDPYIASSLRTREGENEMVSEWERMRLVRILVMCVMVRALAQPVSSLNDSFMTLPNCPYRCRYGNVTSSITIPYPFGIGANCALNDAYVITCNNSFTPPRPFIRVFSVQVLAISLEQGFVAVNNPLDASTHYLSFSANYSQFLDTYNYSSVLNWRMNGVCNQETINTNNYCGGRGANTLCYRRSVNQYNCMCKDGYEGNPYVGCQDINECEDQGYSTNCRYGCENLNGSFRCIDNKSDKIKWNTLIGIGSALGALLFLFGVWWTYKLMKRRRKIKIKKKFFKKNGGLLLQQQLSSGEAGNLAKTKLFTSKELEKATDNYNKTRILGHGGQGTVYKGMLTDGRIVAIKMSNKVDEEKLEEFINEVVILSQINHRHVVKLHGCCLETEVPLLVYEFIPNGTLFHYIHDGNEDFLLYWDVRLRIAAEVASSLAYLHSAASKPIYHRDIKSINILLDDKYRAKVADFGTSKSIAIDQTHCTTRVQGTFGYLDPEYFQSSQFTDKSDVYSFGVVLVELLTSQKPISSTKTDEGRSLATRFILAMKENRLFDILDARILKECVQDQIIVVANLAKKCLNLNGKKRPSMKEVAVELERIIRSSGAPTIQKNYEEVEYVIDELVGPWEATSTSTGSYIDNSVSLDIHPLL